MALKDCFNKIKELYFRYEKILLPISFFAGLFWDNLTLRRVDLLYENSVFVWNLFQAILCIALINAYDSGRLRGNFFGKIAPFLPIFLQFSFGNLFSGFIVFYLRSGSFWASWPFIFLLGILFLGNEFFRKRYARLTFQISVFFIAIFSYSVFALPVLVNKMGAVVFLASGALALLACGLVLYVLFRIMPEKIRQSSKHLLSVILSIYLVFQILYFANIIPPIPLSLKGMGIYHSIELANTNGYLYKITFEPENNTYLFYKDQSSIFHWKQGSAIYCYSAIFSPADLNMPIFHRWMHFDEEKGKWVESAFISFEIKGGRVSGYKGYTFLKNIVPGKWRVDVATERGQVLGRQSFTVVDSGFVPELKTAFR